MSSEAGMTEKLPDRKMTKKGSGASLQIVAPAVFLSPHFPV
jgi:hypothetical protein